jgi:nucleotide-binding universal stress UspA family protein
MIQNLKKILSPIDFSEFSFQAMRAAWELASDVGAELHLLHVVVPHGNYVPLLLARDVDSAREMARESSMVQQAEEELANVKKAQFGNSAKVFTGALAGSPVTKIIDYAEQNAIDLILLSSHGRTGFNRMMLGSTAEMLVRGAPCSVLVFRTRN